MKLYEIILKKFGFMKDKELQKQVENKDFFNPINFQIGGVIKLNIIDFMDQRFYPNEIREHKLLDSNKMTDYFLDSNTILRVVPESSEEHPKGYRSVLLHLDDSFEYSQEFYDMLHVNNKDENVFNIDDESDPNNIKREQFWRINDVKSPVDSNINVFTSNDTREDTLKFWDYSRITNVDSVETEEFLYIEMNGSDGWFLIWRGFEISVDRIEVF